VVVPTAPWATQSSRQETVVNDVDPDGWDLRIRAHVTCAAFSPDKRYVVTGYSDCVLALWDVEKGTQIRVWRGHNEKVDFVRFLADGKRIVSAGLDGKVRFWEVPTAKLLRILTPFRSALSVSTISPDGQILLTVGTDSGSQGIKMKLWNVNAGTFLREGGNFTRIIDEPAISVDNTIALLGLSATTESDAKNEIVDLQTGGALQSFPDEGIALPNTGALAPDNAHAVFARIDSTQKGHRECLEMWDLRTGKKKGTFEGGGSGPIMFSPDGSLLFGSGERTQYEGRPFQIGYMGRLKTWDVATRQTVKTVPIILGDYSVWTYVFSRDGKLAFSAIATRGEPGLANDDACMKEIYDMQTGQCLKRFPARVKQTTLPTPNEGAVP
jgi:WD40 repeat protein